MKLWRFEWQQMFREFAENKANQPSNHMKWFGSREGRETHSEVREPHLVVSKSPRKILPRVRQGKSTFWSSSHPRKSSLVFWNPPIQVSRFSGFLYSWCRADHRTSCRHFRQARTATVRNEIFVYRHVAAMKLYHRYPSLKIRASVTASHSRRDIWEIPRGGWNSPFAPPRRDFLTRPSEQGRSVPSSPSFSCPSPKCLKKKNKSGMNLWSIVQNHQDFEINFSEFF